MEAAGEMVKFLPEMADRLPGERLGVLLPQLVACLRPDGGSPVPHGQRPGLLRQQPRELPAAPRPAALTGGGLQRPRSRRTGHPISRASRAHSRGSPRPPSAASCSPSGTSSHTWPAGSRWRRASRPRRPACARSRPSTRSPSSSSACQRSWPSGGLTEGSPWRTATHSADLCVHILKTRAGGRPSA